MAILQGTLIGKTPLLMHNPSGSMFPSTRSIGRKAIPSPEDEAKASTYRLPNGDLCVPAVAVRNNILAGCTGLRINRRAASPIIAGSLLPSDLLFPLTTPAGEPIRDWVVDTQRAVVQRQGIMRSRARIDPPWVVVFNFNLNTTILDAEGIQSVLIDALSVSGQSIGILDYRPQKKGWYGTFDVGSMRVIES
jgi:hypothetical protein